MPLAKICLPVLALMPLATLAAEPAPRKLTTFVFHHEHILGTSLEIQVRAETEHVAAVAEVRILAEIDRLSRIFSTYDSASEFSRWQQTCGVPAAISPELFTVLASSNRWIERSRGAFQPGIEAVSGVWSAAQGRGSLPTAAELEIAATTANQPHWWLDYSTRTATRLTDCPLTLNAISKGAIVEWACEAACRSGEVRGLIVNLGGDLRVCGDAAQAVAIADPRNDAENSLAQERILVANRAVATSGDYRRGFTIGGTHFSHILDPRTGRPATEVISATVVAPSSQDADALATICNVLPAAQGVALVESCQEAECLLITRDGRRLTSPGWSDLVIPRLAAAAVAPTQLALAADTTSDVKSDPPAAKPELLELLVKFELTRPSDAQYRRPYVAIWLEDADEFPVKTAVLWMQTKQPGPRWHRDLLRWFRNDTVRNLADGTQLIGTISAATRGPGEYKAVFDGRDDAGKPLKAGKYTLYVEAAREHGTYQMIRYPLTLGAEPIVETKLKNNHEIKSASFEYRPREAAGGIK